MQRYRSNIALRQICAKRGAPRPRQASRSKARASLRRPITNERVFVSSPQSRPRVTVNHIWRPGDWLQQLRKRNHIVHRRFEDSVRLFVKRAPQQCIRKLRPTVGNAPHSPPASGCIRGGYALSVPKESQAASRSTVGPEQPVVDDVRGARNSTDPSPKHRRSARSRRNSARGLRRREPPQQADGQACKLAAPLL